ncbi:MAG: AraC family transcriptional regulator [Candidatus Melainabacteria bacterium]|nr:AraC family transcriptional regulator [Candidatus Melainabacteria bacterium]
MDQKDKRMEANREELVERLGASCKIEGTNDIVDNLQFFRWSNPTQPKHGLYSPSMCVVAQGAKEVTFGEERLRYDPAHYLLISLDVPVVSQVVEATPEKPYLGLKLDFDPATIASVIVEAGISAGRNDTSVKSMDVSKLQDDLLDAFVRLLRLVDNPDDFRVVSPMVIREIIYRVLKSEQGSRLRQMAVFGGHTHRITKAVQILRNKYNQNLSMETLAQDLGMSVSSFHQHFKTATSMSPLQFQKMLRLQEARRLLLTEDIDAGTAAEIVGYDDASQFSREYKRTFGEPPKRDVGRFKQLASA